MPINKTKIVFWANLVLVLLLPTIILAQEDLKTQLTEKCYNPSLAEYEKLKEADQKFVLGLPPSKFEGIFLELEKLGEVSDEAQSARDVTKQMGQIQATLDMLKKDSETCQARKDRNQRIVELSLKNFECYDREAKSISQDIRTSTNSYIQKLTNRLEEIKNFDCQKFQTTPDENSQIITLAPHETINFTAKSFCLDGGSEPPDYGDPYVYAGHIRELGRKNLENFLLASAAAPERGMELQEAVWNDEEGTPAANEAEFLELAKTARQNTEKQKAEIKQEAEKEKTKMPELQKQVKEKITRQTPLVAVISVVIFLVAMIIFLMKFSVIRKKYWLLFVYILVLLVLLAASVYFSLKVYAQNSDWSGLDISAESQGDLSELDISLENKTNEETSLDLVGPYFKSKDPKKQRLAIVFKKRKAVPLPSIEPELEPIVKPDDLEPPLEPIIKPK